jgi:hypothetical protein
LTGLEQPGRRIAVETDAKPAVPGTVGAVVRLAGEMKRIADTIERTLHFCRKDWFLGQANAFYLCAAAIRDVCDGKEPRLPDYGHKPNARLHGSAVADTVGGVVRNLVDESYDRSRS